MKYDIIKLDKDITNAENELNKLVENDVEYNKLYEKSVLTDKVIAKYLEAKQYLEQERKKIVKDYSEQLNKPFRLEITSQIKQEVIKDFPNVKEKELNHFSNNVYVYATLRAYDVNEIDIVEQLLYLNNRYFDEVQEDGIVKDNKINCTNIEYLKKLNDKYMKMIKERI